MCANGQVEFERLERKKQARKEKGDGMWIMWWFKEEAMVGDDPWANGCPESVAHSSGLE
jgi:hypothetical protein